MSSVNVDMTEIRDFFKTLDKAAKGDFREELEKFLDGAGNEFLRIVTDEIERRKVMDNRLLLASFSRGHGNNIFELTDGGLTLEVGTNLSYAKYVEDGHWTNTNGIARRWVPGYWQGDRFIYDPNAETGMLLKQKYVKGKHFFDSAIRIYNKIFQASAEAKLQEWFDEYFAGF